MGRVRAFILLESSIQTADTWYRIPPRSGRGGGFEKQRSLLTHGQNTDCVNLTKRSATRRGALMESAGRPRLDMPAHGNHLNASQISGKVEGPTFHGYFLFFEGGS